MYRFFAKYFLKIIEKYERKHQLFLSISVKGLFKPNLGGVCLDDHQIIDLFWKRSEQAISETDAKYGGFLYRIAFHALANREDAEESVNDTYLAAWNTMPPHRPAVLMAFLGKLTRRISINRWHAMAAYKRGGGQIPLALEELAECQSGAPNAEEIAIGKESYAALNRFLDRLPETERKVFLRRYFLLDPVAEIAEHFHFSEAKVTSMLHRTRLKLRKAMKEEGYL